VFDIKETEGVFETEKKGELSSIFNYHFGEVTDTEKNVNDTAMLCFTKIVNSG
jgi:hypothetical protein